VPNQIETLTKDFMADLAVNSLDQAAIYTANVENVSDYVHYVAAESLGTPTNGARVRGIGSGTNPRNYFQVNLPSENYNIERATIASGPNAILFGLGSPAGILDTTPARAQMRNRYGCTVQYDSEESKRATFDANHVLLKDRLALRLMGMSKNEYSFKKPNVDRDDRLYGTLTFKPFQSTTIVLQGEKDNRAWNRAVRIPPTDQVTLWYHAGQIPRSGYTTDKPVFDNTSFTNIAANPIFNRASDAPVYIDDGSPVRSWLNSVTVKNPRLLPGVDQTYDADTSHSLNDPNILPFDVNVFGTRRNTILGGNSKTGAPLGSACYALPAHSAPAGGRDC